MKPIIRQKQNDMKMNKLEASYARKLDEALLKKDILGWQFEAINLMIIESDFRRTYYKPDFFVVFPDHFEVHETKGFWQEDARLKIKRAAEKFWFWTFLGVTYKRGQWIYERF